MDYNCVVCNLSLGEGITQNLTEKGKSSIVAASLQRGDEKHNSIRSCTKVHVSCYKEYTRKSSILSYKQTLSTAHAEPSGNCDKTRLRSKSLQFDIKTHCLFCAQIIEKGNKAPRLRRRDYSCVETVEYVNTLIARATERDDEWGRDVLVRIQAVNDLIAEESKYHRECSLEFRRCKSENKFISEKESAFYKLCKYLESNDECQYSLNFFTDLMDFYLDGNEGYSDKYLKLKLEKYFGKDIIITKILGTQNVITFHDKSHQIVKDNWDKEEKANFVTEKERIINMAASIIRDDIRTATYDTETYPTMDKCDQWGSYVPDSLSRLMHGIIKSKSKDDSNKRRCTSIAHAIISACRPRSFISPVLLSTAVYIHRRYASRELIDILNALGFSDDYREVQRLNSTFINTEPSYNLSGFTQMVFDNADHNIATLTGHDTFHSMGGIACVTPPGEPQMNVIQRPVKLPSAAHVGSFGQVPIHEYKKPAISGLRRIKITALDMIDTTEYVKLAESWDVCGEHPTF